MITSLNIAQQRLHNQHIGGTPFAEPDAVVRWLGAVQAQDYLGALWAVGLRMREATEAAVEQACIAGTILRTHLMRPTWHFVTPADIRWLLALTAPRVNAMNAYAYRNLELDDATFARSNTALANALRGGKQLTRPELASVLRGVGIATENLLRCTMLMMRAELDGVVCSGARRGKQFTYALLDERAPAAKTLSREEALAELTGRYFTSHGPATVQDYVWWSGLTTTDARRGLDMVKAQLMHETVNDRTYWFSASAPPHTETTRATYLLPNFDEYTVAYRERGAAFDPVHSSKLGGRGHVLFNHTIIMDGQVVGTWKRTLKRDAVVITPRLFIALNDAETRALAVAAERYGRFVNLPVILS